MSEVNPFQSVDYLGEARGRVTEQFKKKIVFDRYLQLMVQSDIEIAEFYRQLLQERSLDTAIGAQLDNIGDIVGQERLLVGVDIFEFFGFLGGASSGSFGDFYDQSVGAIFFDSNKPRFGNISLSDDAYRMFIKAKIAKNSTRGTPEEIMSFANSIFSTNGSTIQESYDIDAAYTLYIGKILTGFERSLLNYVQRAGNYNYNLMPKPIGVRVNYANFDNENFFGFLGTPNAKGFGVGKFASLIN